MKRFCLAFAFILLWLPGCATTESYKTDIAPELKYSDIAKSAQARKSVGDVMVERSYLMVLPGFVATAEYEIAKNDSIGLGLENPFLTEKDRERYKEWERAPGYNRRRIAKGSRWICRARSADGRLLICDPADPVDPPFPELFIAPSGKPEKLGGNDLPNVPENLFRPTDIPVRYLKNHRQELVYGGKTKDAIRITYREYSEDLVRPSFHQDVVYDLSESKEIVYRDIRIEVLEATGSEIVFVVK